MKVYYVSPSVMPSRSANSVHVVHMCAALAQLGNEVTLFFQRSVLDVENLKNVMEDYYGVNLDNVQLVSCFSASGRAVNIRIALLFVVRRIVDHFSKRTPDLIISRNLYASFVLEICFRHRFVFETHTLEPPGLRKYLQKILLRSQRASTVVISHALQRLLAQWHGLSSLDSLVLHDAATSGIKKLSRVEKQAVRHELANKIDCEKYCAVVGYFGHLYSGRGVEIIQALAGKHPEVVFLLYGGNEEDIERYQRKNGIPNLHFMGYIAPSQVSRAMGMMDVLLMPYQKKVSVGRGRYKDTGQWMSPLKMFEYMAAGMPIIASRLPVLEEVLEDNIDCLLAEPDDPASWSDCLQRLLDDSALAGAIGTNARFAYEYEHNWNIRAEKIMGLAV